MTFDTVLSLHAPSIMQIYNFSIEIQLIDTSYRIIFHSLLNEVFFFLWDTKITRIVQRGGIIRESETVSKNAAIFPLSMKG